jgi:hypothetical protein
MSDQAPLLPSQRVVQICLFLVGAIGVVGGMVQFYLGQPETTLRLDNVHRFMGGLYFGSAIICLWTGATIRQHRTLVLLLAAAVLCGGLGRVLSMSIVGVPEPRLLWFGYLTPELVIPCIMIVAQTITNRRLDAARSPTA